MGSVDTTVEASSTSDFVESDDRALSFPFLLLSFTLNSDGIVFGIEFATERVFDLAGEPAADSNVSVDAREVDAVTTIGVA